MVGYGGVIAQVIVKLSLWSIWRTRRMKIFNYSNILFFSSGYTTPVVASEYFNLTSPLNPDGIVSNKDGKCCQIHRFCYLKVAAALLAKNMDVSIQNELAIIPCPWICKSIWLSLHRDGVVLDTCSSSVASVVSDAILRFNSKENNFLIERNMLYVNTFPSRYPHVIEGSTSDNNIAKSGTHETKSTSKVTKYAIVWMFAPVGLFYPYYFQGLRRCLWKIKLGTAMVCLINLHQVDNHLLKCTHASSTLASTWL